MGFFEYFKPNRKNLSLAGVILISQAILFTATSIITLIIFPDWMSEPPANPNPLADAMMFTGIFLGAYVAACSSIWWLNEYLER